MAKHKCGHIYLVKQNGLKEKEIIQQNSNDTGKCSVCWKISKTPVILRNKAHLLSEEYCNTFDKIPIFISYNKVDLENSFYKWLYDDFK